jgi:MFS family permease
MSTPDFTVPPKRALALAYGGGLLSMGLMDTLIFVVPLWALMLGASATEVGLLVGARSVLPFVFAIQGGVLMDRFGARRIMAVVTIAMIVLAPLYPALPWIPAMMVVQMLTGLATTIAWVGAQTVIAQICGGDAGYLGRFNFASRIGTFAAPILMGLLWDFTNPWLTFGFVSVWSAALLAVIRASTDPQTGGTDAESKSQDAEAAGSKEAPQSPGVRLADFIPKPADYARTFTLLAIPAITISIAANFLRNTTSGVQGSIYVVYLDEIGLTGTLIGVLFSAIEGASAIGSLMAGRAARRFSAYALMVVTTGFAIVLINITPLLGGIFALLVTAQVVRGIIQGINQPVLFAIQARAAGPKRQGAMVALRVTVNRFVSIILPPVLGIIADSFGIETSFYILGLVLVAATIGLGFAVRLAPAEDS